MIGRSGHGDDVVGDPAEQRGAGERNVMNLLLLFSFRDKYGKKNNNKHLGYKLRKQLVQHWRFRPTRRRKGHGWPADWPSSTPVPHIGSPSPRRPADRAAWTGWPSPGSPWPECRRAGARACASWRSASFCRIRPKEISLFWCGACFECAYLLLKRLAPYYYLYFQM